jgi:hypothetical protein
VPFDFLKTIFPIPTFEICPWNTGCRFSPQPFRSSVQMLPRDLRRVPPSPTQSDRFCVADSDPCPPFPIHRPAKQATMSVMSCIVLESPIAVDRRAICTFTDEGGLSLSIFSHIEPNYRDRLDYLCRDYSDISKSVKSVTTDSRPVPIRGVVTLSGRLSTMNKGRCYRYSGPASWSVRCRAFTFNPSLLALHFFLGCSCSL